MLIPYSDPRGITRRLWAKVQDIVARNKLRRFEKENDDAVEADVQSGQSQIPLRCQANYSVRLSDEIAPHRARTAQHSRVYRSTSRLQRYPLEGFHSESHSPLRHYTRPKEIKLSGTEMNLGPSQVSFSQKRAGSEQSSMRSAPSDWLDAQVSLKEPDPATAKILSGLKAFQSDPANLRLTIANLKKPPALFSLDTAQVNELFIQRPDQSLTRLLRRNTDSLARCGSTSATDSNAIK